MAAEASAARTATYATLFDGTRSDEPSCAAAERADIDGDSNRRHNHFASGTTGTTSLRVFPRQPRGPPFRVREHGSG